MRRAFYFDQSRCMACNACTVACKDWNGVTPGPVRWRTTTTHELETGSIFYNLVMSCNHCEQPICQEVCAAEAIVKRDDGVVYVDRNKCKGLESCIMACPFAAPKIAGDRQEPEKSASWQINHPMQKCDFCRVRLDSGEQPICVAACPSHALDSGDYDELMKKYPGAVPLSLKNFPYAYKAQEETNPSLLIKRRAEITITKAVPKK